MSNTECKEPAVPGNIRNPGWITKFSEVKDQLKTGDIILVHGRYPFSWVIEFLQGSDYGHCAMVVRRSDLDPKNQFNLPDELLLWEANVEMKGSAPNLWRSNPPKDKEGPMLISLEKRLRYSQSNYKDVYLAHRPLFGVQDRIEFEKILPPFFDSVINKTFPTDKEIIHSVYMGRRYNYTSNDPLNDIKLNLAHDPISDRWILINESSFNADKFAGLVPGSYVDPDKVYCSELVAMTYKELGLLTRNHVSNAYAPVDFSDEGTVRLLKRGWLGKEMFIDMCK